MGDLELIPRITGLPSNKPEPSRIHRLKHEIKTVDLNGHTPQPTKNPLDHEPQAVTYARIQAGLTKTQPANACGVSISLISEIEDSARNATPAMIIKLAEVMNCPRVALERKRDG